MPERKKKNEPLEERVMSFIRGNKLTSPGETLLIGVSGGADSTCLILLLNELAAELGIRLHIAHLNHRLRDAESEADAGYVQELARKLGVPVTTQTRDVKTYRTEKRMSLEEAAREVRYTFFAELTRKIGASKVAVGHTVSDHVETVLMHLIRGSGARGLIGLKASNRLRIGDDELTVIRPLLEVTRLETEAYCAARGFIPRIDTTNLSLSALRNRIRLELLPLLKNYNPGIEKALKRTARLAADDTAFIDQETERWAPGITRREGNTVFFDRTGFLKLPPALRHSLLRRAVSELAGDIRGFAMEHIADIIALAAKPAGRSLKLPRGLTFINDYGEYILTRDAAVFSPYPELKGEFFLKIPGETVIPGWKALASVSNKEEIDSLKTGDALTALFDLDRTGSSLWLRGWQRGDRFQPLGMDRVKRVSEFMIDAKFPRYLRKNVPVVASPQQIIWLVGLRIDERVKVTNSTGEVLKLRFRRFSA